MRPRHRRRRPGLRVLVVEDSTAVRRRVVDLLGDAAGLTVSDEAGTVADALQLLAARPPAAVVVDLRLPDGDGMDIVRAARALEPAPAVVILTSYAYPELRRRGLEAGADAFLDKNAEFERLPAVLRDTCARRAPAP
jgi:two-component system response regulator DevR